jgi:glyoxylase-like metal-dependent hydrolase (beta-lactamase superfamily II)/8-oxo-dGTP pyrophosphatase MutT (NUDIX family)
MKIIDSVAAVFCCRGEVFMVRRQPYLDAFPGYDAFPGGKIDRTDSNDRHCGPLLDQLDGLQVHALVREIHEELGYDLPAAITRGQVSAVKLVARAQAPALIPVRFRLFFYRIEVEKQPVFRVDAGEIAAGTWASPQQFLAQFAAGEALMVPPIRWFLEQLQRDPLAGDYGDLSPQFDEDLYVPRLEQVSGLQILPVPSNSIPPSLRTNAFLLGDPGAPQVLVDPSPASPQVLEKLLRTLQTDRVDAIFLTHHHADHHQYAPELARRLQVPVWLSADSCARILSRHGADYFTGISVEFKSEGEVLSQWKGEDIQIYALPGHDAGQLGLAPSSLRWFIVGDLIQGLGTVVIAAPEGDMATYFATLERVIALNPEVIAPSHGMPMRSTRRLRITLDHRRQREKDILALTRAGKTRTEILAELYQNLDPRLHSFALANIDTHLVKLHNEGRLP